MVNGLLALGFAGLIMMGIGLYMMFLSGKPFSIYSLATVVVTIGTVLIVMAGSIREARIREGAQ